MARKLRRGLVYQNFVQNSPLCPINTLMTHGFILTNYGNVSKDMAYNGVLRELRCAFACGSGMVELYNDYALMNSINGGKLWAELAKCIKLQREQADVLPDIHWVGGNPWDGSNANIYGWASWNGRKATLALRNPSTSRKTFTFTLREVLEIPSYVPSTATIKLSKAFDQSNLTGLTVGEDIGIDEQLTVALTGNTVFVFNGEHTNWSTGIPNVVNRPANPTTTYDLQGRKVNGELPRGVYILGGKKVLH